MIRSLLAFLVLVPFLGCSPGGVDTYYGRMSGRSVNGTGVLAEALRAKGHRVTSTLVLDEGLEEKADVLIRFATYPGPPEADEAEWYEDWLSTGVGRRLIYVPRDYDAEHDYWRAALAALPSDADEARRRSIRDRADSSEAWPSRLQPRPKKTGRVESWFAMTPAEGAPTVCRDLEGPWAEDVDATKAHVTRHEVPKSTVEKVLLKGDGRTLAMEWQLDDDARVLVVANGSFLLNAVLLDRARRPLAEKVVEWVGDAPRRVVFVEGTFLLGRREAASSLPLTPPMRWVVAHLFAFALIACLARTARLGRPRAAPASDAERPVAHAEALGDLLARTGEAPAAQGLLETYRRWRQPSAHHPTRKRADGP
jgi:hypothetical protein